MEHAAWAHATARGWTIGNDRLQLELQRTSTGGVAVTSLARIGGSGARAPRNWAQPGAAAGPWIRRAGEARFGPPERHGMPLAGSESVELPAVASS